MDTITSFLAMGGYAAYVWSAYAVAAIVLGAVAIASLRGLKAREAALEEAESRLPRRRRGGEDPQVRTDDA